ncbi:MAG: hypothetical protein AAF633_13700, partial [Chloroflexota bacterium]
MKTWRTVIPLTLCITLILGLFPPTVVAETVQEDARACISGWTAAHISATALSMGLSFTPFKAAAIAADGAAHWASVELRHCRPDFTAPADVIIDNGLCSTRLDIPVPLGLVDRIALNKQIIELILDDADIYIPPSMRLELLDMLESPYGHYENEIDAEFSKFYFVTDPISSTAIHPNRWGDLGTPDIHHYNADVYIVMNHPGNRINWEEVEFETGVHTVNWTADTTIQGSDLVWIPDLSGLGSAKKKAQKEAAKKTWKQTIKGWYQAAKKAA